MRIAVPSKGRLHDPTVELFEQAGLEIENGSDRKLYADTVDPDINVLYARAADVPEYVAEGAADLGVTGLDQVRESGVDLEPLLDLEYGRCRIVVAAPDGEYESLGALGGKRVATEFPRITRGFFDERAVEVDVVEVSGATELTPHADMADAIVDITSTGTTLEVNNLEILEEVLQSSVYLFARPDVVGDRKVDDVKSALESVVEAEDKRYLMMNVPEDSLDAVKEAASGLGGPTVMDVEGEEMVALHAVVDEDRIYETVNAVRREGARDILVVPIERMIR